VQARDIITERVITVTPDTPVAEVAALLLKNRISAVPVEDAEGHIIGMISEADLMHRVEIGGVRPERWWLAMPSAELAEAYAKSHGQAARDVMHPGVHSVAPDTDLIDVIAAMEKYRVKRVLVMETGRLRGIITRANLLRGLLAGRVAGAPSQSDRAIRSTLLRDLREQPWTTIADNNVTVVEGVVSFWGSVFSDEERRALRAAAENIPGVKNVEDHTHIGNSSPAHHRP